MLGTDNEWSRRRSWWGPHHLHEEVPRLHSRGFTGHDGICSFRMGQGGEKGGREKGGGANFLLLELVTNRKAGLDNVSRDGLGGACVDVCLSYIYGGKGLAADWLLVSPAVCRGLGKRQQRCIVGKGEEASVGAIRDTALVEEVWVEPKTAAWREGGGVTVGVEERLLDDQLTVLQVKTNGTQRLNQEEQNQAVQPRPDDQNMKTASSHL